MKRRVFIASAAIAGLGAGLHVNAQVADLNDAINKAGRQRMLSQRESKAYLAQALQIDPERASVVYGKRVCD